MNYYLDIDGTIISKEHKQVDDLNSFLSHLLKNGNVYWLTTHCKEGSIDKVLSYLKPILDKANFELIKKIKATSWQTLKTEAINFSEQFMWFDDYILEIEKEILKRNNSFDKWVKIDLSKNKKLTTYPF